MWEKIQQYQVPIIVAVVALVVGFGASLWWTSNKSTSTSSGNQAESAGDNLPPLPITKDAASAPTAKEADTRQVSSGVSAAGTNVATVVSNNELEVRDQASGNSVAIAKAALKEAVWLVVHEDRDGAPGNALGALWLPAGINTNALLSLLRDTQAGKTYYVMIHTDAGADHQFDLAKDVPLKDSSGKPIMVTFKTIQ